MAADPTDRKPKFLVKKCSISEKFVKEIIFFLFNHLTKHQDEKKPQIRGDLRHKTLKILFFNTYLFIKEKVAQRTGLEPATPGVTG